MPYKDKRAVAATSRRSTRPPIAITPRQRLERFAEKWDPRYPMISAGSFDLTGSMIFTYDHPRRALWHLRLASQRRRTTNMGDKLVGRIGAVTLAICALGVATASADFSSGSYSHSSGACNSSVDPISLVLYGPGAYYSLARAKMESALNANRGPWSGNDGASQYANSHGYCTPMDGESYDSCGLCNRNHVRLNQTHHRDTLGRYETVGTPHYDQVVLCGGLPKHRAQSYVYTRNYIVGGMSYWYGVSYQNWGNTQAQWQCDGSWVANDGNVAWVNIG